MLSPKNHGMRYLLLFISLLLIVTLACQTLLGGPESEEFSEETTFEPLPAEQLGDSLEGGDEEVLEEASPEEEIEESDQETASETTPATTPDTDPDSEEDDASDVQESSETADEPEDSSEQAAARPLSEAEPLVLGRFGFLQVPEGRAVDYAFVIENPNADFVIQDSDYQIAFYDSDGTVLGTDSGFINLVLPSEETAIFSNMWLEEGLRAAEIEVQINSGEPVILDSIPALVITTPRYFSGGSLERATGILESQFGEYMEDVIVTVVAYDSQGNIVGWGKRTVKWIDPGESIGVDISITAQDEVDSIGMYARTSNLSLGASREILPEGAANFELVDFGHYQDENRFSFVLVTQNPNPNFAIGNAHYYATAYANDGSVLFVARGLFDLILPGEQMAAGGSIYLDTDEEIARIDYRLRAGEFIGTDPIPLIGAENISYLADEYSPTVTGEVLNPFSWDLEDVRVWAILYDEDDNIIGMGYDYVELIPANGKAATEMYVGGRPNPARVELYPAVSSYEEVEGPPE